MGVTHLALNFCTRHEGGHRVNHQDVNGTASYQHIRNFKRLFTGVGLSNEQIVTIDPESFGICGIKRMFRIDKSGNAVFLLGFGYRMQRKRGFTGSFGAVYFNTSSPGQPADSQRLIEGKRTGRNNRHIDYRTAPQFHNGTFTKLTFDLGHSSF